MTTAWATTLNVALVTTGVAFAYEFTHKRII
jgi:hypothetical protein